MNSKFLLLSWQDFFKGLILAVITAVLTGIMQGLNAGSFDWKAIGTMALTALIAYLLKNLGTDEEGKFLGKL